MTLEAKAGTVAAVGALAVAGPGAAQAWSSTHGRVKDQHAGQSRGDRGGSRGDRGGFSGFGRRGRSFGHSVFGILVSWTAAQTGTNTFSGSITVSKPNFRGTHHSSTGSSTQPIQVTFTFTNARAFFGPGANPPAAGDLVKIIGSRRHHRQSSGSGTGTSTGSGTSTSPITVRAILIAALPSSSSTARPSL